MKHAKKLLVMLLVVVMVAAMVVPAYAEIISTGYIEVMNPAEGKTYDFYKVFDAAVDKNTTGTAPNQTVTYSVSYYVTNPELIAILQAMNDLTIQDDRQASPFKIAEKNSGTAQAPKYLVTHKDMNAVEGGRGWLGSVMVDASFYWLTNGKIVLKSTYDEEMAAAEAADEKALADYNATPEAERATKFPNFDADANVTAFNAKYVIDETKGTDGLVTLTGWGASAAQYHETYNLEDDGLTLKIDSVPTGYYLMNPNGYEGEVIPSVDTTEPNLIIYDKNPTKPMPGGKNTEQTVVEIGDTVTFVTTFEATNYFTASGSAQYGRIVTDYTFNDYSADNHLKFIHGSDDNPLGSLKSVKFYTEIDEDGNPVGAPTRTLYLQDEYSTDEVPVLLHAAEIGAVTYTTNDDNHDQMTFKIPWAVDKNAANVGQEGYKPAYEPLYAAPIYVAVEYDMIVDKSIMANAGLSADGHFIPTANGVANNTSRVDYTHGYLTSSNTWSDTTTPGTDMEEHVYSTGISIAKARQGEETTTKRLDGATFKLYKLVNIDDDPETPNVNEARTNVPFYYKWDAVNGKPTWVEEKDAVEYKAAVGTEGQPGYEPEVPAQDAVVGDIRVADNSYDTIEFAGLTTGTYYLEEIDPPAGYVLPGAPFKVVITGTENEAEDNMEFTGKLWLSTTNEPSSNNLQNQYADGRSYVTGVVPNATANPMPATGAKGTVALIAVGSVLFLGAAIVLVTKKRMYNAG